MKVTFTYQTTLGATPTTALALGLGQRLSPISPVNFSGTGVAQLSHPVRAAAVTVFARGGGVIQESLVCQKEHSNYAAAVIWSRVTLGGARGKQGTLLYEFDAGGSIRLLNAVLTGYAAAPGVVGILTLIRFDFTGASWTT